MRFTRVNSCAGNNARARGALWALRAAATRAGDLEWVFITTHKHSSRQFHCSLAALWWYYVATVTGSSKNEGTVPKDMRRARC